jgi:tetratricopeptide (TPR) repeat protein
LQHAAIPEVLAMKPDRFDLMVIASAIVLCASALVIGSTAGGEGTAGPAAVARLKAAPPDPAAYQKIAAAETLMNSEQFDSAIDTLKGISADYPAMSEPHALLGQAYARLLDYPAAMREYRTALVMDPDYVDKKSRKFIGKRIKSAVKDGMSEAKDSLANSPDDKAARAALKDAYYLERMLAGGCE